ncbi:MAG: hypothetical protein JNL74_12905 [Fibrobacteres bacterium]|nr:hypothetical protein [Fibrobacterota bacterium]
MMKTILFCLCIVFNLYSETRSFVGTRIESETPDVYAVRSDRSLITFAGFNKHDSVPPFKIVGDLDFNVSDNALRIPVRTLRRNAKAGGYYYAGVLDISSSGAVMTAARTIPSGNPDLGTALLFFPESVTVDSVNGLPETFVRYFKRAKVEVVEYKIKDGKPRLLWARNRKVESSVEDEVSVLISRNKIEVTVQDSVVYSGDNPLPQFLKLKSGIWASTKGNTHGGGNLKFDRIRIESVSQ